MEMQLDKQLLVSERQRRAWSQTQLAQVSGLSLRTIQRIEKTGKASLESTKALASVFSLQVVALYEKQITQSDASETLCPELKTSEISRSADTSAKWFSKGARNLSVTVFIISSSVLLFTVITGIAPKWIDGLRDAVFNAQLSESTLTTISSIIALLMSFTVASLLGVLFDVVRKQGVYSLIVAQVRSGQLSPKQIFRSTLNRLSVLAKAMLKPAIATSAVLIISGCGIYLSMEDYQKQNLSRFIQNVYSSSEG